MSLFTKQANDVFAGYDVSGAARSVNNQEAQVWGAEVERVITAFTSSGSRLFTSLDSLNGQLGYPATTMAWVIGDPVVGNNGIYQKLGAEGTGSWVRRADLPYSFIVASDSGAGTPNAIQATTSIPVSSSALVLMNVFEANTGSPVTVSFNGGAPLTIKTNSGNDPFAGGLSAGMLALGVVVGTTFRLVSDQASETVLAGAEAAAQAAEAARDEAVAAASNSQAELSSVLSAVSVYHPAVAPEKIRVSGYAIAGDGGTALYAKATSEPAHPGKFAITLAGGTTVWYELFELVPFASMFGAIGGGGDDSLIVQKLVDFLHARGGGTGRVSARGYLPASTVQMKDNVTIVCDDAANFITTNLTSANPLARFLGTQGVGVAIAANVTRDDRTITTVAPHGLSVGDLFYIFGHRDSLGPDATEEYRLGTGNSGTAYYAEFGIVAAVNSTTSFTSARGLVFADYRAAGHGETDPNARASTTIHKITPVKNAHWIGGKVDSQRINNSFFRGDWAWGCTVEGVNIDGKQHKGGMTLWRNCYECDTVKAKSKTDPATAMTDLEHDDWNHHKITSSHDCNLIECESLYASQCWDISYFAGEGCNLYCGVYGFKSRAARYNAGTTHPGAYGTDVIDGKYLDNRESGVAMRSRNGTVRGNRITGNSRTLAGELGIALYDGWARDLNVTGNTIEGFFSGILIWDSSNTDGKFGKIRALIDANQISKCAYGIRRTTVASNLNTDASGLVITNNRISRVSNKHIEIDGYTRSPVITDNHCHGPLTSGGTAQYIHCLANVVNAVIARNHFYDGIVGDVGIDIDSVTDTTRFPNPQPQWASEVNPNYFHNWAGTEYSISSTYIKVPDPWRLGRPGVLPLVDGVSAPTQIAGYVQLYVDSADGDLKVKFSDGVTKTISVDT